jgi:pantoate--beta-alanine ligase
MRVIRTIAEIREALAAPRRDGRRIGLVPTMGALHEGHLSLVRRARVDCDIVVASIFVNPAQFNDARDLAAYPRTEAEDSERLADAGVDVLFAPENSEVYPDGFSTTVDVGVITEPLEGATRGAEHFRGVATVVAKLLNIVQPHAAFFGQKDAQQVLVVRRLVSDLDIPVEVIACPTVREADGLAMSSRNARLSPDARIAARGLFAALLGMQLAAETGEHAAVALLTLGFDVLAQFGIERAAVDYLAVVHPESLQPIDDVRGGALLAIAAHVGGVRLIDNMKIPAVVGS